MNLTLRKDADAILTSGIYHIVHTCPECGLVAVNICNYSNFHSKVSFLSFNRHSYM